MLKPIDRYSLGTCGHLLYFLPGDKDVALLMLNLVQNQESLIVFPFKQKMINSVGKFFKKGLETVNMKGKCGSKTCPFLSHQDLGWTGPQVLGALTEDPGKKGDGAAARGVTFLPQIRVCGFGNLRGDSAQHHTVSVPRSLPGPPELHGKPVSLWWELAPTRLLSLHRASYVVLSNLYAQCLDVIFWTFKLEKYQNARPFLENTLILVQWNGYRQRLLWKDN